MVSDVSPTELAARDRIARRMLERYGAWGCGFLLDVVVPELERRGLLIGIIEGAASEYRVYEVGRFGCDSTGVAEHSATHANVRFNAP